MREAGEGGEAIALQETHRQSSGESEFAATQDY